MDTRVVIRQFQRACNQVDLFQGKVGYLWIDRMVVLAQMVEFIETYLYLMVAVELDDHRASSDIADTLVVLIQQHHENTQSGQRRTVSDEQQPTQQVGTDAGCGTVFLHHAHLQCFFS